MKATGAERRGNSSRQAWNGANELNEKRGRERERTHFHVGVKHRAKMCFEFKNNNKILLTKAIKTNVYSC